MGKWSQELMKMNTRKHTLAIRLACLALVAFDAWMLTCYPTPATAVLLWAMASMALLVAIAPCPSRFKL